MEISYWTSRWKKNKIGWHMQEVYPPLVSYWNRLELNAGDCILVPLCGKSKDLGWLARKGVKVLGVEVSKVAVNQFFSEMKMAYTKKKSGAFTIYESGNIQLWQGDFFKLKPSRLPSIDAIYDKAALVALPLKKRREYAQLVLQYCSPSTPMLVSTFEYPQDEMSGPPFSVFRDELEELYGNRFNIELLHEESVFEKLSKFQRRGLASYLREKIYLLEAE
ncbi:thiopurine S-methyltransferase [Aliifodinibius sp. S!AR15-10]|uniref:thiopurine S-methyltransferase n=1 Tax=Aliifodinibius sp. S!AR15-10 TaxID=2950437 RepID=UPI002859F8DF|nr:thiopurine S-methyltransferase [Aliifodinibius sp. S!AR15-10]MDR8394178.1 thiopurine S-methyltransferase [Aliifodinibius sp. S!AR15-10]